MTREEAIKRLKRFDLIGSNEDIEFQEALDMAIKALEQEPCTVTEFADRCRECGTRYGKLLKEKSGRWIKHDTGHSIYYACSRCSCLAPCTETADKWLWKLSNYCPDCGAKMVKSQESED